MNRREALSRVSILLGGAIVGADFFLAGCKAHDTTASLFSKADIGLLDEIAETIIPATPDSGGGKAARIGEFMKNIISDCYTVEQQKTFTDGLVQLKSACHARYKKEFSQLPDPEKAVFLTDLYREAKDYVNTDAYKKAKEAFDQQQHDWARAEAAKQNFGAGYLKKQYPPHYFTMMRQLTLWGYFSSQEGMTKALRYMDTPGHYDGAYPYKKGDKAWA